jgi:hypothetical protein
MYRYLLLIAAMLLLTGPAIGTPLISAALGDRVPLEGFAPGADEVYLFLTGPNLPVNGVRIDDISAPVVSGDPSSFTRTSVDDYRWEYTWYTRTKGGVLDAGTYTIFIVTKPVGRRELAGSEYATIMVSLGSPGLVVLPPGGVTIRSSSQGGDSFPEGIVTGTTPLEFNTTPQGNPLSEKRMEGYVSPDSAVVGTDGTPKQDDDPITIQPVTTPPETIPIPVFEVLAAIGCGTGIGWFRKRIE